MSHFPTLFIFSAYNEIIFGKKIMCISVCLGLMMIQQKKRVFFSGKDLFCTKMKKLFLKMKAQYLGTFLILAPSPPQCFFVKEEIFVVLCEIYIYILNLHTTENIVYILNKHTDCSRSTSRSECVGAAHLQ